MSHFSPPIPIAGCAESRSFKGAWKGTPSATNDATQRSRALLLIVEDDPQVGRMLGRFLSHHIDQVLVAATPEDAEQMLMTHRVTHIIVDYDLGEGSPRGNALAVKWRRKFRTIEHVLLLTGRSPSEIEIPAEVDRFLLKGEDPLNLLKALKL